MSLIYFAHTDNPHRDHGGEVKLPDREIEVERAGGFVYSSSVLDVEEQSLCSLSLFDVSCG